MFEGWQAAFPDVELDAVDLHAGLNLPEASMTNYASIVDRASELLSRPLVVCGWSMGGLAAMMAAERVEPDALVLLEPSPPAEVQGVHPEVKPAPGIYDAEQVYAVFPAGVRARPESALARGERKRGISVPRLPRRTLLVYGEEFAEDRGRKIASTYGADELRVEAASHWGLVLEERVRRQVADWISRVQRSGQADAASSFSPART